MYIQEYCKTNRRWAAKDKSGYWHAYLKRPFCDNESQWFVRYDNSVEPYKGMGVPSDSDAPEIDWEKSLIAPDGRFIMLEPSPVKIKHTHFKVGHWYKPPKEIKDDMIMDGKVHKCIAVTEDNSYLCREKIGILSYGKNFTIGIYEDDGFIEVISPYSKSPKKYDIVFTWDDEMDPRLPPEIRTYWGRIRVPYGKIRYSVFPLFKYIKLAKTPRSKEKSLIIDEGCWFDHVYPFDPAFIGLSINDILKEIQ